MKQFKWIGLIGLVLLSVSCSNDDDSSDSGDMPTTQELLTTGTWYQESKSPGDFTDCEKNSSFNFKTDNSLDFEAFDDSSGPCESVGIVTTTYSLSGMTVTITFGSDVETATIVSISESTLVVMDGSGDTITFDRTQG